MAAIKDKVRNCGHHHSPYRLRGAGTSILQGGRDPSRGANVTLWRNNTSMDASTRSAATVLPAPDRSNGGPLPHPGQLPHKGSGWFLALTALGVVFGDIGTSPLYTFSVA